MMSEKSHFPTGQKVSRRTFLRFSTLAVGGIAVAACVAPPASTTSSSTTPVANAAEPAAEVVSLRLQNWFSEGDLGAWQIGLDMVAEAHPEIELQLEYNDYGE